MIAAVSQQVVGERREVEVVVDEQLLRLHVLGDLDERAHAAERNGEGIALFDLGVGHHVGRDDGVGERRLAEVEEPIELGRPAATACRDRGHGASHLRTGPAEIVGQGPAVDVLLQLAQPHVLRAFEVVDGQPVGQHRVHERLGARTNVPPWLGLGEPADELVAVDAVVPQIVERFVGHRDLGAGHLADDVCDLTDPVVLLGVADVEGLVVNEFGIGFHEDAERTRDVLDVHQWSPRRAVALEEDASGRHGEAGEVVDHEVAAQSFGDPVGGGIAKVGRGEAIIREFVEVLLDEDLRLAVRRYREELRGFVEEVVAVGAVGRTRRGEQEPSDPRCFGQLREASRRTMVDLVGRFGVEVACGVIAHSRKVDDGIDIGEMAGHRVPDVDAKLRIGTRLPFAEHARLEQHAVHADDFVASRLQHRDQHGADVAVVAGDENSHVHTFHGASPDSQSRSSMTLSRIVSMHAQKSECL